MKCSLRSELEDENKEVVVQRAEWNVVRKAATAIIYDKFM